MHHDERRNPIPVKALVPLASHQVLTERVYEAIKQAIFSLELQPGAQVVEADIASRLSVSKTPVRDALQRLTGERLLTQMPYRGTTVRVIERSEVDEIYQLREVLEPMAVRLATPLLDNNAILEAERLLGQSTDAIEREDRVLLAEINREFHGIFGVYSGNRPLRETLSNLSNQMRLISVLAWRVRPSMSEELSQHRAILEATIDRDADKAAAGMYDHIHGMRLALQRNPDLSRVVPGDAGAVSEDRSRQ